MNELKESTNINSSTRLNFSNIPCFNKAKQKYFTKRVLMALKIAFPAKLSLSEDDA